MDKKHKLESFEIFPSENSFSQPLKCTPIKSLPHHHIPLSLLHYDSIHSHRLLTMPPDTLHTDTLHTDTLHTDTLHTDTLHTDTLFVKIDSKIAAIERVANQVYALTYLGSRITTKHVRALKCTSDPVDDGCVDGHVQDWTDIEHALASNGRTELNNVQHAEDVQSLIDTFDMSPPSFIPPVREVVNNTTMSGLRQLQTIYFDALYISKSPLSYFAKLNLPRFISCTDNPGSVIHNLVMTVPETDYKYKIGLPGILLELEASHGTDHIALSDLHGSSVGLDAMEYERVYVQRWWNSEESVRKPKLRAGQLSLLKQRETKLQIILALEMLCYDHNARDGALLVDILFDRLYIWQAVSALDALIASNEKTDPVREFCLEVVIPFYGARLPKQTERLLQKCGQSKRSKRVSSSTMPIKRRPTKKKPAVKSGVRVVRGGLSGSNKTLERREVEISIKKK
ncbi:DNA replication regulator SLD3-domain-containing protein [Lipomyces arxii]|uniref:DNA replication regulator SLD3-domain-containing protein n=1 Tax=Lipomyces arxii TaxID=56418 RepID=UPI0034CFC665